MEDFCIIMIGEEDFMTTDNYFYLLQDIRKTLQRISHTNILICSPIFRCNKLSNMYNWRIENFNRLLYRDVQKHEYAYLIDSNLNLAYDYTMFHQRTGIINNRGMQNIFDSVREQMSAIQAWLTSSDNSIIEKPVDDQCVEEESLFFR